MTLSTVSGVFDEIKENIWQIPGLHHSRISDTIDRSVKHNLDVSSSDFQIFHLIFWYFIWFEKSEDYWINK